MSGALGVGLAELKKIGEINAKRTAIAHRYLEALSGLGGMDLPGSPSYDHVHAWHLFVVKARSVDRKTLMQELAERNIGYGLHFPACHTLSFVKKLAGTVSLPVTEAAAERILSLPLFPSMDDGQVERVITAMKEIFA